MIRKAPGKAPAWPDLRSSTAQSLPLLLGAGGKSDRFPVHKECICSAGPASATARHSERECPFLGNNKRVQRKSENQGWA